ncbi:MAG: radical SAM protein [Candidatus Omnitrophica bacterium]|nr:radical SAM protein [Candidatus Omnitrophota bacterium]
MKDIKTVHTSFKKSIKKTKCLCSSCLEIIDGEVFEENGEIWLYKQCGKDGEQRVRHLISNPIVYYALQELHKDRVALNEGLIFKTTYRCNQQCLYCFMSANEHDIPDVDKKKLIGQIKQFKGDVVYLSGGEPTLRDDLCDIIAEIKNLSFRSVLFTNGKKLTDRTYVRKLKKTGLDAVILQFDSLDDEDCLKICGEKLAALKMAVVENLKKEGMCTLLYVNVVGGINDTRVKALFDYAISHDNIRLLFFNPLWPIGRRGESKKLNFSDMLDCVVKKLGIPYDYFIESTRFSTYVFEILRKLRFREGIKEPPCSVSCYLLRDGKKYVSLDSIINLPKVNHCLQSLEAHIDREKNRCVNIGRLLLIKEFYVLLCATLFNVKVFKYACKALVYFLSNPTRFTNLYFMFINVLSVMVGQYPDKHTIEFSLFKTCNMHTESGNGKSLPTCLREIYADAGKL